MPGRRRTTIAVAGLLPALALLGGCNIENIHEPWVTSEQRSLIEGELERNEAVAERLRDRLARGQADR